MTYKELSCSRADQHGRNPGDRCAQNLIQREDGQRYDEVGRAKGVAQKGAAAIRMPDPTIATAIMHQKHVSKSVPAPSSCLTINWRTRHKKKRLKQDGESRRERIHAVFGRAQKSRRD